LVIRIQSYLLIGFGGYHEAVTKLTKGVREVKNLNITIKETNKTLDVEKSQHTKKVRATWDNGCIKCPFCGVEYKNIGRTRYFYCVNGCGDGFVVDSVIPKANTEQKANTVATPGKPDLKDVLEIITLKKKAAKIN
jgi:tRNA(Ile2) C34 agmatinyltransferase TiaS